MEGNVYIVGYESKNIHQITSEGEHVRTISTTDLGISKPWVLRFQPNSAVFLLTSYDTGKVLICKIGWKTIYFSVLRMFFFCHHTDHVTIWFILQLLGRINLTDWKWYHCIYVNNINIYLTFQCYIIQVLPFDEVNTCFYRPNESISTEDEVGLVYGV
jgi:hypothetical protein